MVGDAARSCRQILRRSLALMLIVALGGCLAKQALVGIPPTDLSELRPRMKRAQVEAILGEAIDIERTADNVVAYYSFDRGYIPPTERNDEQLEAAAFIAFMGLISAGLALAGGFPNCGYICQQGRLKVVYDSNSRLVAVKEPTYSHVDNSYCWTSGKRRPSCDDKASHPRPSTLSPVLAEQSSDFLRQFEQER